VSYFGEPLTRRPHIFALFILVFPAFPSFSLLAQTTAPSLPSAPIARSQSESGAILGKVTDVNDNPVAGATINLRGPEAGDALTAMTDSDGFFTIQDVQPGIPYHATISAPGFASWESPAVVLKPGQREVLGVSKLRIEEVHTTVTVTPESSDEMAVEQVKVEEKQRGFGVIPNFFAVYDPNPAPLNAKLKFALSFRAIRDPFTAAGVAVIAGAAQAAGHPAYVQGAKGYGERFGAIYANQFSAIMIGGAVLPSLLRQDPRYFYQGSGTKKSRALHALANLFVAKADSGRLEPNVSSLGGDMASAAVSNLYYPEKNEGARLLFENFAINTAVHAGVRLLQEFVFRPTKGTVVRKAGKPGLELQ
jgi:carboxypeptidase family protein